MKTHPSRGSHLPVLMKLLSMTSGSIVELGCGMYSTTYLHWACYPVKRRLVTYESKPEWFEFLRQFETEFHIIRLVDNWDVADLSESWDIAFVDHAPDERRIHEIKRLGHSGYVAVHDTDNKTERKYRYSTIFNLFKYRYKYRDAWPHTSVFSNMHDLTRFTI